MPDFRALKSRLQKRYEQQSNSWNHQQYGAAIGAGERDDFC
jgi:hypothetical protein